MPFDAEISGRDSDKLIFQRTRDRIARGWMQPMGGAKVGVNKTCLFLALLAEAAVGGADAFRLIKVMGFNEPRQVYAWNDQPGRTHAEVLARVDAAIASFALPA